MPGAFRSKVKDIMKQYRSGDLKGRPSLGGPGEPESSNVTPFTNKFDAKAYAFETAREGLDKGPKFYDTRLGRFKKKAGEVKPATETPAPLGNVEIQTKPPEPQVATKNTPTTGKADRKRNKLALKSRRMINRGMKDVYDIQNVDPYKKPTEE